MALEPAIDHVLDAMLGRFNPILSMLLPLLRRYTLYIVLLIGLPFYLFLLLVSTSIFHWWHFPWSGLVTLWLFQGMTIGAAVNALIYGVASVLFFVTWWRKKLRVPAQKRLRMAVTYTLVPLFYGLIIGWGITMLKGHTETVFAYSAIMVFVLMVIALTRLRLLEPRKPVPNAT